MQFSRKSLQCADQHCVAMQGSFYNLTLQWLIKHNFPPGPIHLTRTHKPTLPVYASVGNFKVKYMQGLRSKGAQCQAFVANRAKRFACVAFSKMQMLAKCQALLPDL